MQTALPAYFLPSNRRDEIIAYLVRRIPQYETLDWSMVSDEHLLEAYNFTRMSDGLPAIVVPTPEPRTGGVM